MSDMTPAREQQRRRTFGFLIGLPLMLVFLVGGAVGAFKGGSALWLEYTLLQHGVATDGEVIRSVARSTGPGPSQQKRSWHVVTYQFDTETGRHQTTIDIEMYENPPRTGDDIKITYLPENPDRNWPLAFRRGTWNWFMVGFGALIAVFSAVIVIGMLVVRFREHAGRR